MALFFSSLVLLLFLNIIIVLIIRSHLIADYFMGVSEYNNSTALLKQHVEDMFFSSCNERQPSL